MCLNSKEDVKKALESGHTIMNLSDGLHEVLYSRYEPSESAKAEESKTKN